MTLKNESLAMIDDKQTGRKEKSDMNEKKKVIKYNENTEIKNKG